MEITVKLFASLRKNRFSEKIHTCPDGFTVSMLIDALSLPRKDVTIVFINNRHASFDQKIREGDTVSFFPATGGG